MDSHRRAVVFSCRGGTPPAMGRLFGTWDGAGEKPS